jgi:C4-dicarboxylate-specific signal transduction histidine kinase
LPHVLADEPLFEQVFVNLLLNAFEAMNGNSPAVLRLSIAADTWHSQPGVSVAVQDTGPGVPAELREQIFNPFFTSKKSGVGLGLSIVAKIIDDHRGSIQLECEAGRGACFRVFLPADPNI